MKRVILDLFVVICVGCMLQSCTKPQGGKRLFEHVVVIGIDGMSVDGLKRAATPVIDDMIAHGAVTYESRTVLPSVSSPNWGAMIHGVGTEASGITSNDWKADGSWMKPITQNKAGRFPGIFNVVREQLPEAEQGTIFDWGGFGNLVQKDVVNLFKECRQEDEATQQVCDYIVSKKPVFLFIQLSLVDNTGHGFGYKSDEYLQSIAKSDSLTGRIMESIRKAGMADNTLVMVVSDHGGIGHGHGGESMDEASVPVVYYGKGVKQNYKIQQEVYMYDVAANVAFALNLKTPYAWTGRPTLPAFEGYSEPEK